MIIMKENLWFQILFIMQSFQVFPIFFHNTFCLAEEEPSFPLLFSLLFDLFDKTFSILKIGSMQLSTTSSLLPLPLLDELELLITTVFMHVVFPFLVTLSSELTYFESNCWKLQLTESLPSRGLIFFWPSLVLSLGYDPPFLSMFKSFPVTFNFPPAIDMSSLLLSARDCSKAGTDWAPEAVQLWLQLTSIRAQKFLTLIISFWFLVFWMSEFNWIGPSAC